MNHVHIKIPIRLAAEGNNVTKLVKGKRKAEHWSDKAKRVNQQKFLTITYLKQVLPRFLDTSINVTLTRHAPRKMDDDNIRMAFKAIRDAIAEYVTGCTTPGRADSDERISWNYCQEKTTDKEHYITIDICPIGAPSISQ
jgi:hypothetical protein